MATLAKNLGILKGLAKLAIYDAINVMLVCFACKVI